LEGFCNRRCWSILRPFGLFYGYLVYFVTLWYIFSLFGTFFPVLVYCTMKNLATLVRVVRTRRETRRELQTFRWAIASSARESVR
jgi:uncharacterized membrane protein YiaA